MSTRPLSSLSQPQVSSPVGILRIANNGPRIISTNYWSTQLDERGLFFLSINAGVLRLLIPQVGMGSGFLDETAAATRVAVQIAGAATVGVVHLLFEDDTQTPYFLSLDQNHQINRSLPMSEVGRWVSIDFYSPGVGNHPSITRTLPAVIRAASWTLDGGPVPIRPRHEELSA